MAKQAGVPVVPVAIKNSDVLMGKGTGEARSGTIEMVFMPPMSNRRLKTDQDINDLIARVRSSIADRTQRGHDGCQLMESRKSACR